MTLISTIEPVRDALPLTSTEEVKRLEKTFDLAKEMFSFSENLLKSLDEKSRGSVTAASAIAAFAFLVNKPVELALMPLAPKLLIAVMALSVGAVYALNFAIVRPQKGAAIKPDEIVQLLDVTTGPEEVVYFNVQALTGLYRSNLELARQKAGWLAWQHGVLAVTLLAALAYVAVDSSAPSSPATSQTPAPVSTPNSPTPAKVAPR